MTRLTIGLALALALAGCSTASDTTLGTLEPAAGTAPATAAATPADPAPTEPVTAAPAEGLAASSAHVAEAAPTEPAEAQPATPAAVDTSAVDQAAQTYLTCVVSNAARSAEGGQAHTDAVEVGIDACRNQFREARWAYKDTGVSDDAADRYGANLLAFVRNEALTFLDAPAE